MSSLYLQLNLCLALAWILCRLLPRFKTSFRSRKMLAQGLLLLSLLAPLVFAFIPESSLPTFTVPMMVKDIDADQAIMAPVRKVLQAQTARPGAEGVSNGKIKPSWWLWFWVALTGLVGM